MCIIGESPESPAMEYGYDTGREAAVADPGECCGESCCGTGDEDDVGRSSILLESSASPFSGITINSIKIKYYKWC